MIHGGPVKPEWTQKVPKIKARMLLRACYEGGRKPRKECHDGMYGRKEKARTTEDQVNKRSE